MNIEALDGVASARLIAALSKLDSDNGLENKKGLDELTALTKRSDDCTEVLDLMLQMGLVQKLLSFLSGKSVPDSQLVPVKGLAAEALLLPLGQALQVAALAALGELIWQRDTASDFRPVLQAQGGLAVLGTLVSSTSSEPIRLKALVLTRRLMYEEARDSQLLGAIAGLVPRALDPDDASVTSSSLEGVTYLLQRMQVCLSSTQKEDLDLAAFLRSIASTCASILRADRPHPCLGDALMAVRELAWDDHNKVVEPGISCMAEAGVFDALAGLLTPGSSPGKSPEAMAAAEGASISKAVADSACAMLERLAAAPEGSLAPGLAAQVPRLLHQVISHLVKQLDTAQHVPERQDAALSALRKLLVTENSQSIPPAAAEAADAEGVPSRLRSVALSSEAFGGQSGWGKGDGAPESTAAAAAALLADLTVSSSLSAAYGGRPAQAAESLREVEPVVEQLMAGLDHDVEASRNFCQALYKLSLIRYDEAVEGDGQEPDTRLSGPHWQHAPPESEQYELTSQLVTMVGHAATGLTLLLLANQSKPQAAAIPRVKAGGPAAAPGSPGLQAPAASSAGEAAGNEVASTPRGPDRLLERLQRASLLMHELAGLKPLVNSRPLSYHNIDALFVHGTCQALLQGMGSYYNAQRAAAKALQRAAIMAASASNDADSPSMQEEASGLQHAVDAALAAAEETEDLSLSENGLQGEAEGAGGGRGTLQLQSSFMLPQLSPSRYASFAQSSNPLLQPLLHHETGALELMKEVVRDYDGARLKLRDIGALHLWVQPGLTPPLTPSLFLTLAASPTLTPLADIRQSPSSHLMDLAELVFARMLGDNLRDNLLVSLQFNLARSEALHSALKQEGCVQLMAKVLAQAPQMDGAQHEVRRLLALITLGLVASDEILTSSAQGGGAAEAAAGARQALALLDKHDLPGMMERVMRDACRDGRFVISSTTAWPFMLEPAALTVQCLARSPTYARRLADKKIPAMLLGALRNKHGSQPQVALWLVRALLNFARLPDLRPALLAADCLETLLPYTAWDDLRVADAARGCLLQLGELPDLPCKLALQSSLPEAVQPSMSQPLPPTSPSSPAPPVEPVVDVLISYKRQDAHAFARMLHTLLITRGVSCLLDFEYGQDLSDVRQVVSRCRNLVVVLTDNVLTSPRCLEEMEAAVRCDVNTVTVVKEGARWGDASGNMVGFPPQPTLRLLQPEVQKVFALKPLHHRDAHYAYFVTQLMRRIKLPPRPTALHPSTSLAARSLPALQASGSPLPPAGSPQPSSSQLPFLPTAPSLTLPTTTGPATIVSGPRPLSPAPPLGHANSANRQQQRSPIPALAVQLQPPPSLQLPGTPMAGDALQLLTTLLQQQSQQMSCLRGELADMKSAMLTLQQQQQHQQQGGATHTSSSSQQQQRVGPSISAPPLATPTTPTRRGRPPSTTPGGAPGAAAGAGAGPAVDGDAAAVVAAAVVAGLAREVSSLRDSLAAQVASSTQKVAEELGREMAALAQQVQHLATANTSHPTLTSSSGPSQRPSGSPPSQADDRIEGGRGSPDRTLPGEFLDEQQAAGGEAGVPAGLSALMHDWQQQLSDSLAGHVAGLRGELGQESSRQLRGVAADILELRRGMTMLVDGLQGVQGLVKSLAASSLRSSGGPDAYNMSASMRMAPYIMTATHPEGAIFHSTPLDATSPPPDLPHGMSASMPSLNAMLAANSNGAMLPPIANGYNGSPGHGERQSRNPHKGSGGPGSGGGAGGGNGTAASNTTPGGVLGPAAVTPHVGGFQGARIAAQQARLTAISGRTMAVKH
ncbi:hypothetical protein QJQ45_007907 [Haematococcus lacustris]|nr:hypothetical protein QJQ45_007907 [Haematococcus lacustris]